MPPGINDNVHAPPTPPPEKYGEVVKKPPTVYVTFPHEVKTHDN